MDEDELERLREYVEGVMSGELDEVELIRVVGTDRPRDHGDGGGGAHRLVGEERDDELEREEGRCGMNGPDGEWHEEGAAKPREATGVGPESLTVAFAEARRLAGVSRNTFYKLAQRGVIPGAQKLGGTWRFHREKLLLFLACEELGTPSKTRRR